MNAFAARVVALWQSPRLTVWLVGAFLLWAGIGVARDVAELRAADGEVELRHHVVAGDTLRVALRGQVSLLDARHEPFAPLFRGDLTVESDNRRGAPCVLGLDLSVAELREAFELSVRDEAGRTLHARRIEPVAVRITVEVPLPRGERRATLHSTDPALALRCASAEVRPGEDPAAVAAHLGEALQGGGGAVAIRRGPGWFRDRGEPEAQEGAQWNTRGQAGLVLVTDRPGPYRVRLPLRLLTPGIPPPDVLLDGVPVTTLAFDAAAREPTLRADVELHGTHLLALRAPVTLRSGFTLRPGKDARPFAYAIRPARIVVEPR